MQKEKHRDVANRTNEQLQAEHNYLEARLFSLSSPALYRKCVIGAELGRRGLIKYATYSA